MFQTFFRFIPQLALPTLVAAIFAIAGCAQEATVAEVGCKSSRIPCLNRIELVSLETEKGQVILQLDGVNAPLTAGNFADLVKRGVYNGTIFHRVIRSPLPFVVQGGDPGSADPKVPASLYGTGNFVDPATGEARFIPLEFTTKSTAKPIYGQEVASVFPQKQPILTHDRGSLAMARSADPNSASAQFYIALKPLPELDGRYAVFGKVVRGMDVVDRLQQGDKLLRASIVTD